MNDTRPTCPAGLLRTLGALCYDALLVVFAIWVPTLLILVIIGNQAATGPLVQSLLFLEWYAFVVYFWTQRGQTLGMLAWGLHIESNDGAPVTPLQATLRFFAAMAGFVLAGAGYLWMYIEPGRRTWGDLVSGTRLYHTRARRASRS